MHIQQLHVVRELTEGTAFASGTKATGARR